MDWNKTVRLVGIFFDVIPKDIGCIAKYRDLWNRICNVINKKENGVKKQYNKYYELERCTQKNFDKT